MYEKYWGLNELPFENVPDPRFMYHSTQHGEALMRLLYATKAQKGAAMLSGEVGCGKTTVSRAFVQELSSEEYEVGIIANPSLTTLDFLKEILYQLGIEKTADSKPGLLHILNDAMLQNLQKKKKTVLIIDDAQVIEDVGTFEELRLLLNFQLNNQFLLTLILIGQPELRDKVVKIPQLDSRISIRYHLKPLDLKETAQYILFRLKIAGMQRNIFTKEAIEKIREYTGGVPRKINNICDLSLLVGFSKKVELIDSKIIQRLIDDAK
ncbi:MAG TPA: ExeA family protein [Candidatus Wunengus sp. YC60]|uniref:ExeA family protein n=1 Tax=Candidatus Wunengus sp. YC60 TaxID=3367697 RepID=UPI0040261B59